MAKGNPEKRRNKLNSIMNAADRSKSHIKDMMEMYIADMLREDFPKDDLKQAYQRMESIINTEGLEIYLSGILADIPKDSHEYFIRLAWLKTLELMLEQVYQTTLYIDKELR